jgi:hypothetical protein
LVVTTIAITASTAAALVAATAVLIVASIIGSTEAQCVRKWGWQISQRCSASLFACSQPCETGALGSGKFSEFVEPFAQVVEAGAAVARGKLHGLVFKEEGHSASAATASTAAAFCAVLSTVVISYTVVVKSSPRREFGNDVPNFAQALLVLVEDGDHWDAVLLRQLPLFHTPNGGKKKIGRVIK